MKDLKISLVFTALLAFNTAQAASDIEVVAELDGHRPGNPTVTPTGRIIFSQHPMDKPELRVVELMANGTIQPFPNLDWADGPDKGEVGLSAVIGIDSTEEGIVWILDMGSETAAPQLVGWDSVNNHLFKVFPITKTALVANSFLQDFALDTKRNKVYIADMTMGNLAGNTKPAFVVLDLTTGNARRVLQADARLMPSDHKVIIDGSLVATMREDGKKEALYMGLNPITIDHQNEWVYFGTINGSELYRMPASVLADESATAKQQAASIEVFGEKRPSDGITIDQQGNVYITDIENSAVGVTTQDGYHILAQDKTLLSWPDGFAIDQQGWLYVAQNQLHLHPILNEGEAQGKKPYRIVRIKLPE